MKRRGYVLGVTISYRVELYNDWSGGRRWPSNGWGVARLVDGRRNCWVRQYGGDEASARMFCAYANARLVDITEQTDYSALVGES